MKLNGQWRQWQPGDPVTVNRIVWDQAELDQLQEVLNNDWFGPGPKVAEFSRLFTELIGLPYSLPYCQPVNSGSSALTLAVEILVKMGYWRPGDFILHPLLTFPTSIAPAIRAGLIPVFVDVDPHTYQIDLDQAEITAGRYRTSLQGAIIPHLLGNICDLDRLDNMMGYLGGGMLIEDCCDTLGGYYGKYHVGTFGDIAAFSFYGSHHITTGGVGGAFITKRQDMYDIAKSMTHWGRTDYDTLSDTYQKFEKRYWYDTLGHDYQMTELQAAWGIAQLDRVKEANALRLERRGELDWFFRENGLDRFFYLPYNGSENAEPSWFAYPITIKEDAPFSRRELATYLIAHKIEIRPIFTGNILRQPAFRDLVKEGRAILDGGTKWADLIGSNGLFLPAWGMADEAMDYMLGVLDTFFKGHK